MLRHVFDLMMLIYAVGDVWSAWDPERLVLIAVVWWIVRRFV